MANRVVNPPILEIALSHVQSQQDPESATYARDVLQNMSEAYFLLDREFRLIDVNAAALALDGRPKEQLVGQRLWDLGPGLEATELGSRLKDAMRLRRTQSLDHLHTWDDGRTGCLEVRLVPAQDGVAAFYRDVSEERSAQKDLRETGRRFDAILSNTTMAMFLMDHQQQCVYANAAAETLTGTASTRCRDDPCTTWCITRNPTDRIIR